MGFMGPPLRLPLRPPASIEQGRNQDSYSCMSGQGHPSAGQPQAPARNSHGRWLGKLISNADLQFPGASSTDTGPQPSTSQINPTGDVSELSSGPLS
jgi:hypothetical protein